MSVNINWGIPATILNNEQYTSINIYRGSNENNLESYKLIANIDRWRNNNLEDEVSSYTDATGSNTQYYFVKYKTDSGSLSKMLLTVFELTPKQLRWVTQLRSMLDPIITSIILKDGTLSPMTDEDLMLGINMAIGFFNAYPPVTEFNDATFPRGGYETIMLFYAQYFTLMSKMLGLSLRDFSYSDNGLSLNQQFSPAIQAAMSKIMELLNPLIAKTKMEFSIDLGTGLGSTMYAVGMNGRLGFYPMDLFTFYRSLGQ